MSETDRMGSVSTHVHDHVLMCLFVKALELYLQSTIEYSILSDTLVNGTLQINIPLSLDPHFLSFDVTLLENEEMYRDKYTRQ